MGSRPLAAAREERCWQLSVGGLGLKAIGERLGAEGLGRLSVEGVRKALARAERRALAGLADRVAAEKVRQVDALELIYREAMAAWERSREPVRLARRKTVEPPAVPPPAPGADGNLPQIPPPEAQRRVETTVEMRGRAGDPRFLGEARAALADLRKLLGLDSPTRVKLGGLEGAPPVAVAVRTEGETIRGLSTEALREMDREFQRITGAFQPSDIADMGRDG
ncbi:MAG TPA: hypothetical protein VG406_15460 [Isosphaeraceae bacterium]|jgi:hypothetical protein|nr:hypothetical protein [Isosphaeraceae bacterium]